MDTTTSVQQLLADTLPYQLKTEKDSSTSFPLNSLGLSFVFCQVSILTILI